MCPEEFLFCVNEANLGWLVLAFLVAMIVAAIMAVIH